MKIKKQITVFLENQPGAMALVCKILMKHDINIHAFTVFGTVDHGVLRMVLDRPSSTTNILSSEGILAIQSEVIEIKAPNEPGTLHKIADLLCKAKINIEYGYGSTSNSTKGDCCYIQASNNKAAFALLKSKLNIKSTRKKS